MQSIIGDVRDLTTFILQEFGDRIITAVPECSDHVSALLGPQGPFTDIFHNLHSDYLQTKYFRENFNFVVSTCTS